MKNLKLVLGILFFALLLSGCARKNHEYGTRVTASNPAKIHVSQDSTFLSGYGIGEVIRTDYKYSFGVAATTAINRGYTYFSIDQETPTLIMQYKDRNVKTIEDAYNACDSGSGSFSWGLTRQINFIAHPEVEYDSKTGKKNYKGNYCEYILAGGLNPRQNEQIENITKPFKRLHGGIKYSIELHNEDRQDNVTFNAQEVLNSKLLEGLNKDYFLPNSRADD